MLDHPLMPLVMTAFAVAAGMAMRVGMQKRQAAETARKETGT